MLDLLDECAAAVKSRAAAARLYEDPNEGIQEIMGVLSLIMGKESAAAIQAGRDAGKCDIGEEFTAYRQDVLDRRIQMEGDLDQQNGAMVAVLMLADYGQKKLGEAGFVPESEVEFIPCRRLTEDEIANWPDPCSVPCVGNGLRIAAMLGA